MYLYCYFVIIVIIRQDHSSWYSPTGVILMGGFGSGSLRTTEKIQQDGSTSSFSFELKYDTL